MDFKNIAIIGVGLIGGSFALSLKKAGFSGTITGIGRNTEKLAMAKKLGAIDKYSTVPEDGIKDADLIFLSTPVGQFPKIIERIKEHIKRGSIVTDAGSVKAEVVKRLEPLMPEGASFVGGHPIAGKECSGVDAASSDLFNDKRCILTPGANTDKNALNKILDLWNSLGSKTVLMTPDEHDSIFAVVSHMPHVAAYALVNSILEGNDNILHHGGRGLRDLTRIALSPPELWRDICSYNKENILKSLNRFSTSITRVIKLIEKSDWVELEKEFQKAKAGRQTLESD